MSDTIVDGPEVAPVVVGDARVELAEEFLRGDGLEIGALHLAMWLPAGARARYVDRMSVEDLRAHYPELAGLDLAPVDVIDDGERLATVEPESVDFIVANHFLEHCEDPIRTIGTHLGKLRPGGVLFYAVPDKRYTFDFRRPRTPLEHLIADHEHGPERSRDDHYLEWTRLVYEGTGPPSDAQARAHATQLQSAGYSIHFHVWTQSDLVELMLHCQTVSSDGFELESVRRRGIENIVVLRKRGEPAAVAVPVWTATPAAAAPDRTPPAASTRTGIPLAGLRARLDRGSAAAHWSIDPDGLHGRAWVISTEAPVTVPLTLDGAITLQAHAALLPHDWRDGTSGVRAWATAITPDGNRHQLWTATLTPATDPAGVAIDCQIPADTIALELGAAKHGPRTPRSIARVAILEPYLTDPRAQPEPPHRPDPTSPQPPADGPLISILCPVHDPPAHMLQEAIDSVKAQTYGNWELILSDDGSQHPEIIITLDQHATQDPRIKLCRNPQAGGISTATNTALEHATGQYIALLDHDDTLHPHALAHIAHTITNQPNLDMIYTDEDIVLDGRPVWVHHKPAWSPDTLRTNGYTCHLGVYRRTLVEEIGGFRAEFDGSQDVDMILRLVERSAEDRIAHVPETLYHWRAHASSTAGGDAKPYAYVAARNAIVGSLERSGIDADVEFGPPGLYRVVHRVDPGLGITIVLAMHDTTGLHEAARSWLTQPHPSWHVTLTAPPDQIPAVTQALHQAEIANSRITILPTNPSHDPVTALHTAAQHAHTEHLLLMQTPLIGLTHNWLTRLLGYSHQDGIAAAGPIILTDDGRITHAGIAIPNHTPLPLLHGMRSSMDDFFGYGTSVYDVLAVDGALATSRDAYHTLGGLDPHTGPLALIDYCLRAHDHHLRTVTIPDVRLRTIGPDTTTNDLAAIRRLTERRRSAGVSGDAYYNPNFRSDRGDFVPRSAP